MSTGKTIAVIGSGIAGISAAWNIDPSLKIVLLEQSSRLGGHTHTHSLKLDNNTIDVDSGFIVFNKPNYPMLIQWLKELNVSWTKSNMSFSFSLDNGNFEWSGKNLGAVFSQKSNLLSPSFFYMLYEINRFNKLAKEIFLNPKIADNLSINEFLSNRKFGKEFCNFYLFPMASAIWSTPETKILNFPAINLINFFSNHGLLNFSNHFEWYSIMGGSKTYIDKFLKNIQAKKRNIEINLNKEVKKIEVLKTKTDLEKVKILGLDNTSQCSFEMEVDGVVFACHSNQSAEIIKESEPSYSLLKKIKYQKNTAVLHEDESLMPVRKKVWSAWNYISTSAKKTDSSSLTVTYWMNSLQQLHTTKNIFVTLNADQTIKEEKVFKKMTYEHPLFDFSAMRAQSEFTNVQGINNYWFAGAWLGYGFHEDGFASGKKAAEMLNKKFICS
jgi:predicted NAD/FAD-binding protein